MTAAGAGLPPLVPGLVRAVLGIVLLSTLEDAPLAAAEESREAQRPFSLQELETAGSGDLAEVRRLRASDGVELAYRAYLPRRPIAALVFYHGGGAHSGAGYAHLAAGLRDAHGIAVYTPDLRGHGESGGERGDAPSPGQLLVDFDAFVELAREAHRDVAVFVGGHSSGAGLTLNYASWPERAPVAGYVFLSPQLGFRSDTDREKTREAVAPFVDVSIAPFIVNAVSGGRLMGHTRAVVFNYPPETLASDPRMVGAYTVNLANGITPGAPRDQFAELDRAFGLWIGASDELFDPDKVIAFGSLAEKVREDSVSVVVPGQKHLGILVSAHELLGPWIEGRARPRSRDDEP